MREDLVPELRRLAATGQVRLAIVELWDSVEPKAMAEVVVSGGLTLTGVITAVDPALLLPCLGNGDDLADTGLAAAATDQRTVADTFARQLEYAPVLAILDSEEADDEDRELLRQLHPTALQIPLEEGDLANRTRTESDDAGPARPTPRDPAGSARPARGDLADARPVHGDPAGPARPVPGDPAGSVPTVRGDLVDSAWPVPGDPAGLARPVSGDPVGSTPPVPGDPAGSAPPTPGDPSGSAPFPLGDSAGAVSPAPGDPVGSDRIVHGDGSDQPARSGSVNSRQLLPYGDSVGSTPPRHRDPVGQPPPPLSRLAVAALAGFDVEAAAAAQHPACALLPVEADAYGVSTFVWHRCRPFHPERLYAALEDLTCAAARSRGRFWLADKPDSLLHWDAAGGALCVEGAGPWLASLPDAAWELVPPVRRAAAALDWHPEHGDRCQHLVFTSPGLDRDGLERLLEHCLLTDAEYAAGRAAWKRLPPAFDTLLEI
ncbi:GTP-binding protein [Streptomyces galilaeus]